MATKLKSYSTTPGSNNSAAPNGWPEGMLPSTVNDSAREMMARLAEWYADAEWLLRADTVTGFTGTTLTITGDVTATYAAGRVIRLDESNSKRAIILSSSYGAPSTTVTVSGYTIVGLPTAVEVGIANLTQSAPKPRQDVASAATLNLDSVAYEQVNITGTTPVTAITLTDGRWRNCRADGALPITTGASLIINGIASGTTITFAAGDTFEAWGEPTGVVRIVSITRVGGGADGLLSTTTVSGAASASITLPAGYRYYEVRFDATLATDGEELNLRIGTGAPPTYQSAAGDYEYSTSRISSGGTAADSPCSTGDTAITIATNVGSAATEGVDGKVSIYNPANTARHKNIIFDTACWDNTPTPLFWRAFGGGSYNTAATAITGLQFLASSGNISGTFNLYAYA